jgi:hypothetical protein
LLPRRATLVPAANPCLPPPCAPAQAGRPFHRTTTSGGGGGGSAEGSGGGAAGVGNSGGGSMSYEDFVYFILSEEDKTTDASLDYWFRCGWLCAG